MRVLGEKRLLALGFRPSPSAAWSCRQPLGPVTASRAPGSSVDAAPPAAASRTSRSGSVRPRRRRAAMRDAGELHRGGGQRGGRLERRQRQQHQDRQRSSVRPASANAIAATTAPSTLVPTAAVGAAAARAAGAAARSVARPHRAVPVLGFGDARRRGGRRPAARARARAPASPRRRARNDAVRQHVRRQSRRGRPATARRRPRSAGRPASTTAAAGEMTAMAATAADRQARRRPRSAAPRGPAHRTSSSTDDADPGHQFAAVQPHRRLGGRVGQPAVQPLACVGRGPQRGVVRGQPLAVAEHAARDAERAHRHHGDRQVEHRRHLPRPGDQPRRDAGQRQRAAQRQHPEHDGQQQPRQRGRSRLNASTRTPHATCTRSPIASTGSRWPTTTHGRPGPRARRRWRCSTRASSARVQVRRRLVEQQHRRRRAERPGQAEPLPLAERQADAAAADHGVQPVGQRGQHLVETRGAAGAVEVGERTEQLEVVAHAAGHQHGTLGQPRHLAHQAGRSRSATSMPATGRRPRLQSEDRLQQRALAAPLGPVSTVTRPGSTSASARATCDRRARRRRSRCRRVRPVGVAACRAGGRPCRRPSFRPVRRGTPTPTRRSGQNTSGASSSAVRPADSVTSPNTSRSPTLTATSATPSVASSSSTSADRNAIRSVAIAERRWAAPSSAIRCAGPSARPSARSVGMPATRSSSRDCRVVIAASDAADRSRGDQADEHHEERDQRQRDQHDHRRVHVVAGHDRHDRGRGEDARQEQRRADTR